MFDRVLVLSPHTDDGELGCGGSIAKFVSGGSEVFYVALSACEKSVPEEFPSDILKKEVSCATKILGVKQSNLSIFDFEVREFSGCRQSILDTLIEVGKKVEPDIVFTPSSFDTHQDHQVVRQETLRAFKRCSVLGYEQPWNNVTFNTSSFVLLSEEQVQKKIEALGCYVSQKNREYFSEEFVRSLARTRGVQVGSRYAETFEVIKWVIR